MSRHFSPGRGPSPRRPEGSAAPAGWKPLISAGAAYGRRADSRGTAEAGQERGFGDVEPGLQVEGRVIGRAAPQVQRVPEEAVDGMGDDRRDGEIESRNRDAPLRVGGPPQPERPGNQPTEPTTGPVAPAAVEARRAGSHQPGAHAPGRGRRARGEAELAQDVSEVPVHRVLAQHQHMRDVGRLAVGAPMSGAPRSDVPMSGMSARCRYVAVMHIHTVGC
jgi:hypothetical protein